MDRYFTKAVVVEQGGSYGTPKSYLIQLRYSDGTARGIYGLRSKAKADAIAAFLTDVLNSEGTMADMIEAHDTVCARNVRMRQSLGLE